MYNNTWIISMLKKYFSFYRVKNLFRYLWAHKIITIIGIVILVIVGFLFFPKNSSPVLTQKAVKKDIVKTVSVTGDIDSENSANLSFQTAETLSWVGVKLGDTVTKGQAIASLDQNKLAATLRQTQQDFIAAKAASQQYYDNHTNATESDQEKVQRTAIDDAQNKAYDQMLKAQYDLAHSTIYSPIDGIVTRIDASVAGVNITPATVFTITDLQSLSFKMEVDESDIGQIEEGQKVNVSLDSFPDKTTELTVDQIDFVSHKTSSGGNAFYVKANFNSVKNYRIGMSGNADIITGREENVLSVPTSSIFDDNYVYVQINNKFEKRKLTLGLQNDTDAQVISGISEGEVVALDPTSLPPNKILKK